MDAQNNPIDPDKSGKSDKLRKGLEAMSEGSATLKTWALSILGGSIAAFVGSDYLKPTGGAKLIYLAFIPGWALLGISLYFADELSSRFMAIDFAGDDFERLKYIGSKMNTALLRQKTLLSWALVPFGLWLILFLLWWIFFQNE